LDRRCDYDRRECCGICRRANPKRLLIDTTSCHVPDRVSGIRALVPLHTNGWDKRPNRRLITSADLLKPFWLPTPAREGVRLNG
jgi:hypothetical protein